MQPNPYERFSADQLILRDQLAIDRTVLANERTLLAFVRTGLALAITGAGIAQLYPTLLIGAWGLVAAGVLVTAVGFWRYRSMRLKIRKVDRAIQNPSGEAVGGPVQVG